MLYFTFDAKNGRIFHKIGRSKHFFRVLFGGMAKTPYLCIAFKKNKSIGALSSAGLEHLPYKQRVGGSNPSAPTQKRNLVSNFGNEVFLR